MHVNKLLANRAPTQAAASKLLGISQPHVSELKNYKLDRFSLGGLLRFVTLLGCNVEIVILSEGWAATRGQVTVSLA